MPEVHYKIACSPRWWKKANSCQKHLPICYCYVLARSDSTQAMLSEFVLACCLLKQIILHSALITFCPKVQFEQLFSTGWNFMFHINSSTCLKNPANYIMSVEEFVFSLTGHFPEMKTQQLLINTDSWQSWTLLQHFNANCFMCRHKNDHLVCNTAQ